MRAAAAATPHHLSTDAAMSVLADGGNAVDAAIAAVAVQGVVAPETCGLGGDLFALVHKPGAAEPLALNASGRAGSGADARRLRDAGLAEVPSEHPAAVTIPGCADGLGALAGRLGTMSLGDLLSPAISHASGGFIASGELAGAFRAREASYRELPAAAPFYPDGAPVAPGDLVRRPRLAEALTALAEGGREGFYQGVPGQDVADALGGTITPDDLAISQADWVSPIGLDVWGLRCWTIPPNSQGYLGPATLAVFEMLDPPQDPTDPAWWHLLIEAYRAVAWERDDLVADPGHAPFPAGALLSRERLERASRRISPDGVASWPGSPASSPPSTAYLCTADGDGMGVSIIQSNYRGTGSVFGAARSGFILHDRGSGFSLMPGHPNEMMPGKRPLHTLSPTSWSDSNGPRWLLGTRGGAIQPQLVAQAAARAIFGREGLDAALEAPRWALPSFGPGEPSRVRLEPGSPAAVPERLEELGHSVEVMDSRQPGWGPISIIELAREATRAASDPRVDTASAAVSGGLSPPDP